jgi:hypothetical protein
MSSRHEGYNCLLMTHKEILLNWIDVSLPSSVHINQDNLSAYLGDTQEPFVRLIEYKIRKQLLECYLEKPYEETIDNVLQDIREDYVQNGYTNAERRAINKVLTRFNKPTL